MLKPLTLMAHVLLFFTVLVQAQSSTDKDSPNRLCLIGINHVPQKVNLPVTQEKPCVITCSYEDVSSTIPKFLQFSCDGGSTLLTVQVNVTDGEHTQTITKDIQVNENNALYEMPVLAFVSNELVQGGKARIKSIVFTNNMNISLLLSEINFSNMTANYEIKMNQVFTVDLNNELQKKYYIKANAPKEVSINLYRANGEFDQKITKTLVNGENFVRFDDMQVKPGKYVVVISEFDNKKVPISKITVMY